MKKWLWIIAILSVFMLATDCPATYRIELNTGTSFVTNQYWEEDGQIKFNNYGGTMGFPKDMVTSITDSEAPVPREIVSKPPPVTPVPATTDLAPAQSPPAGKDAEDKEELEKKMAKSHVDMQKNHAEASNYAEQYRQAREQNDKEAMAEAWKHLQELQAEQTRLRQELRERLNGDLPEWWDEVLSQ